MQGVQDGDRLVGEGEDQLGQQTAKAVREQGGQWGEGNGLPDPQARGGGEREGPSLSLTAC